MYILHILYYTKIVTLYSIIKIKLIILNLIYIVVIVKYVIVLNNKPFKK